MNKRIVVKISFEELPKAPNHHLLAVALEKRIEEAVALAMADAFVDGGRGKSWDVYVPSF